MSNIIDGKQMSREILNEIKQELKFEMIKPSIAVIQIGNDKASETTLRKNNKLVKK